MVHNGGQMASQFGLIIRHTFSRKGLFALNALFLGIMAFSLADITHSLGNSLDDTERIEAMLEGLATVFVAYGVALEEREFLMRISGYYPAHLTPQETYLDHIAHHYGVLLLIVGLVTEVIIQIVKIPDRYIDSVSFEPLVYTLAIGCFVIIGCWLVFFCRKLVSGEAYPPAELTLPEKTEA